MAAVQVSTTTRGLAPRWRKLLLATHVATSVGLLGTDAAVLLLAVDGARGGEAAAVYPAAREIGAALLVPLALAALVTGIALGLLTPWGLFRHWWVVIKLALTTAGAVLALVVLTPTLSDLAAAAGTGSPLPVDQRLALVRDSAAASVVLLVTLVLSIYKPFGKRGGGRVSVPPPASIVDPCNRPEKASPTARE